VATGAWVWSAGAWRRVVQPWVKDAADASRLVLHGWVYTAGQARRWWLTETEVLLTWSDTLAAIGQGSRTGTGLYAYTAAGSLSELWSVEAVSRNVSHEWQDALTAAGVGSRTAFSTRAFDAISSLVEQWSKSETSRAVPPESWTETLAASGSGSVQKTTAAPSETPGTPTLGRSGNTLTATWTNTATAHQVRVFYQTLDGFLNISFEHSATFEVAAGSTSHVWNKPSAAPNGHTTRVQLSYFNAGGSGPSSAWSNTVTW
jgi:hypothetical protein